MLFPTSPLGPDIPGFMKEIGYDALKESLSENEIVLLDWPTVLKRFHMDSGRWCNSSELLSYAHGNNISEIETYLSRGTHRINISVHVTSNRNSDALLLPFESMSRYTAPYISMRRLHNGPGDLYLTDLASFQQTSALMVFKNIFIDISSSTELEIREFADYLYDIMANAVVQKNAYQIPEFTATVSASTIHSGEQFTVTLNAISDDSTDWHIKLKSNIWKRNWSRDDLNVVTHSPYQYTFKALKPGVFEIGFDIFHTRNLMSYLKKVPITILK